MACAHSTATRAPSGDGAPVRSEDTSRLPPVGGAPSSHRGPTEPATREPEPKALNEPTPQPDVLPTPVVIEPARPIRVITVGEDASWIVGCTAERPRLYSSVIPSRDLDAFIDRSPDGRYVVVEQAGRWILLDTRSDQSVDLSALGVERRGSLAIGSESLAFHPDSSRLALLTRTEAGPRVLVRELSSGTTSSIEPASTDIRRVSWDPTGRAIVLSERASPPGSPRRPPRDTVPAHPRCPSATPTFTALPAPVAAALTIADPRGGKARPAPGFLGLFEPDGFEGNAEPDYIAQSTDAILLRYHRGVSRRLLPMDCEGRMVAITHRGPGFIVRCGHEATPTDVRLVSPSGSLVTEIPLTSSRAFDRRGERRRYLPLYAREQTILLDLWGTRNISLLPREQLLAQTEDSLLIRRNGSLFRRSITDSLEVSLAEDVAESALVQVSNPTVWLEPYLVSADPRAPVMRLAQPVVAVTARGCALTAEPPSTEGGGTEGTLKWHCLTIGPAKKP